VPFRQFSLFDHEIAHEWAVSTNSIKIPIKSIDNKLSVNNRAEAADVARELKLL